MSLIIFNRSYPILTENILRFLFASSKALKIHPHGYYRWSTKRKKLERDIPMLAHASPAEKEAPF